jgi:hypothetical protein
VKSITPFNAFLPTFTAVFPVASPTLTVFLKILGTGLISFDYGLGKLVDLFSSLYEAGHFKFEVFISIILLDSYYGLF